MKRDANAKGTKKKRCFRRLWPMLIDFRFLPARKLISNHWAIFPIYQLYIIYLHIYKYLTRLEYIANAAGIRAAIKKFFICFHILIKFNFNLTLISVGYIIIIYVRCIYELFRIRLAFYCTYVRIPTYIYKWRPLVIRRRRAVTNWSCHCSRAYNIFMYSLQVYY